MIRRKKFSECGHKGLGKFCHRCMCLNNEEIPVVLSSVKKRTPQEQLYKLDAENYRALKERKKLLERISKRR